MEPCHSIPVSSVLEISVWGFFCCMINFNFQFYLLQYELYFEKNAFSPNKL